MADISLQRIKRETAVIEVKGTAPLIVHAWSEKARRMMLDAQMGKKNAKQPKNPEQDFEGCGLVRSLTAWTWASPDAARMRVNRAVDRVAERASRGTVRWPTTGGELAGRTGRRGRGQWDEK